MSNEQTTTEKSYVVVFEKNKKKYIMIEIHPVFGPTGIPATTNVQAIRDSIANDLADVKTSVKTSIVEVPETFQEDCRKGEETKSKWLVNGEWENLELNPEAHIPVLEVTEAFCANTLEEVLAPQFVEEAA